MTRALGVKKRASKCKNTTAINANSPLTDEQSKMDAFNIWLQERNIGALPRQSDGPLTFDGCIPYTVHSIALYVLGKENLPHDVTFSEAS